MANENTEFGSATAPPIAHLVQPTKFEENPTTQRLGSPDAVMWTATSGCQNSPGALTSMQDSIPEPRFSRDTGHGDFCFGRKLFADHQKPLFRVHDCEIQVWGGMWSEEDFLAGSANTLFKE